MAAHSKEISVDNVKVGLSFQNGNILYHVKNEDTNGVGKNNDLQEAMFDADVPATKTNFIVRAVKKALGF